MSVEVGVSTRAATTIAKNPHARLPIVNKIGKMAIVRSLLMALSQRNSGPRPAGQYGADRMDDLPLAYFHQQLFFRRHDQFRARPELDHAKLGPTLDDLSGPQLADDTSCEQTRD